MRDDRGAATTAISAAALVLSIALAACGTGGASRSPDATGSLAPASTAPASTAPSLGTAAATLPLPPSPVTGVITSVDAAGLADVTSMTIRLADGRSFEFRIGTLENGAEFPPGHLKEHMATSSPVRVWFRLAGTELVAYRIEDAG